MDQVGLGELALGALVFLVALALLARNLRPTAAPGGGDEGLRRRVEALERQVALLQGHAAAAPAAGEFSATPGAPLPGVVRATLLAGNKIEAIKLYRRATGVGLKEAKDAVDAAERELRGR